MIKNNFLTCLICLLVSGSMFSQESAIRLLDLDLLEQGKYNKVELEDQDGKEIGKLIFFKKTNGNTDVSVQLTSTRVRGIKVEYFKNQEIFQTEHYNRGPSGLFDLFIEKETIHSETFSVVDQESLFWGIITAAYCCVQIEVGEDVTTNEDGDVISTTTTWSLGFDCDCFGSIEEFIGPNGQNMGDVDSILITAM